MTICLLLLLLAAAAVLARARRRQSARILYILSGLLLVMTGCGPLPGVVLKSLQSAYAEEPVPSWPSRSAIVVLGGGAQRVADTGGIEVPAFVYGRVVKTLELYLQCKRHGQACMVIASGGDPTRLGTSEAKVYGAELVKAGLDPADLVIEGRSRNTWQNAQFCAVWLSARPQEQVVLVTSGFHVRRSTLYFAHFGIRAFPVRADYVGAEMSAVPLAYNFLLMDLVLHEYAGLVRYQVYELLGWNPKAQRPAAP